MMLRRRALTHHGLLRYHTPVRFLQSSVKLKEEAKIEPVTRLFAALLLSGGAILGSWRAYQEYGREPSPPCRGLRSRTAAAVAGGFGGAFAGFSYGWATLFLGFLAYPLGLPCVLTFALSAVCSSNAAMLIGSFIGGAQKKSNINAFVSGENDRAWKLLQIGDVEGAEAAYREVVRVDPYNTRASRDLVVVKEVRDAESKSSCKIEKPHDP